jgi:5-carboxymethyl-2-hydroxymuconate isomerase
LKEMLMPHLVILYTPNIDAHVDMGALCRSLADAMLSVKDEKDQQVFPTGGIRVLAYPAAHYAVADGGMAGRNAGGSGDYGFVYLNLRMARGRSGAVQQRAGQALEEAAMAQLRPLVESHHVGVTLQIDEGAEVFDAKSSSLHPLFLKR